MIILPSGAVKNELIVLIIMIRKPCRDRFTNQFSYYLLNRPYWTSNKNHRNVLSTSFNDYYRLHMSRYTTVWDAIAYFSVPSHGRTGMGQM